jgi:hypothetical protein
MGDTALVTRRGVHEEALAKEIERANEGAAITTLTKCRSVVPGWELFYAEYGEDDDDFCYAQVRTTKGGTEVELFPDGVDLINRLADELDKRRRFWQRLGDFSISDIVGSVIALAVTGTLVWLILHGTLDPPAILGQLLSVILGFYFGKRSDSSP